MRAIRAVTFTGAIFGLGACTSIIGVADIFFAENVGPGGEGGVETSTADGPVGGNDAGTDAAVCVADLKTDLKNCGACGHDCTNGLCKGGLCILTEDLPCPGSLAIGAELYVGLHGGTGAITSCPKNGCASAAVGLKTLSVDAGDIYPYRIAATSTHVFASDYSGSNNGGVERVLATGGDFRRLFATPPTLPVSYGIAIDNAAVYWVTTGSPGNVHWCGLPDCAGGVQVAAVADDALLIAVAADGTIVWGDNSGGVLMRCASKTACTPTVLVPTFLGVVDDLTIDGNTVYWATNLGDVFSCPTAGCATATRLVHEVPDSTLGALAVSGSALYWSSMVYGPDGNTAVDTKGEVKTCTIPNCSGAGIKTLATDQHDPKSMVLDAKSVYWANSGKRNNIGGIGNVVKAPR